MPVDYTIDPEKNLLVITATGRTSDRDWQETAQRIAQEPEVKGDTGVLLDMRAHESVVSSEFVWSFSRRIVPREKRLRWAIVISREVSLGMANMLKMLVEGKNIEVRPFEVPDDAVAWLVSSDDPP